MELRKVKRNITKVGGKGIRLGVDKTCRVFRLVRRISKNKVSRSENLGCASSSGENLFR